MIRAILIGIYRINIMLGRSPGISQSKSQSSSIRHQVRKLRAKVMALIPTEICAIYQKTNQRIQQIESLEKQWKIQRQNEKQNYRSGINYKFASTFHNHKSFRQLKDTGTKQEKQNHILKKSLLERKTTLNAFHTTTYNDSHNDSNNQRKMTIAMNILSKKAHENVVQRYQFQKLSASQIQQINQDKRYYLGQSHIEAFNQFQQRLLVFKNKKKFQKNLINTKKQLNPFALNKAKKKRESEIKLNITTSLHSRLQENKNSDRYKWRSLKIIEKNKIFRQKRRASFETKNRSKDKPIEKQNQYIKKYAQTSVFGALSQFSEGEIIEQKQQKRFNNNEERKQFRDDELDCFRNYHEMRIREKSRKQDQNYREQCYKKFSKMKFLKQQEQQRSSKALKKKRKIFEEKGDISKINQMLRNRFIQRTNKQSQKNIQKKSPEMTNRSIEHQQNIQKNVQPSLKYSSLHI